MRNSNDVNASGESGGLPFLRDDDGAPTMPLGTGGEFVEGLDPMMGNEMRRGINTGALVILAVVLLAGGGLFALRKISQASASTSVDTDIESRVEDFLKRTDDGKSSVLVQMGDDGVLSVIRDDFAQVSPENVHKDPFVIAAIDSKAAGPGLPSKPERTGADPVRARHAELMQAGKGFVLKSVIGGTNPMARLDNAFVLDDDDKWIARSVIVREGDLVHGRNGIEFIVEAIDTGVVTVVAEDAALDLRVSVHVTASHDR